VVVAVGICAASGGIFRECYNISGGVDSVIPVDVYVPAVPRGRRPLLMEWSKPSGCWSKNTRT